MAPKSESILPATRYGQEAAHLIIEPDIAAPDGSVWAYNGEGYTKIVEPWAVEDRIAPINQMVFLGDIESWVRYLERYAGDDEYAPLLTWSEGGLKAVLDPHASLSEPGRGTWIAHHPFKKSAQWTAWAALADGRPRTQQQAVEALEDLSEDIREPDAGHVVGMLRMLRSTIKTEAQTELAADGSTHVAFTKDKTINAGKMNLPPEIVIAIPVLKGHTEPNEDGKLVPVSYRLTIRVRPSVDDATAKLAFRFSMPTAERVFEAVLADRVASAEALLPDDMTLLRSTAG